MNTCYKCGREKSWSEFGKHSEMSSGYVNKCKDCHSIDCKTYPSQQTDVIVARNRKWRLENPERYEAREKAYRQTEEYKADQRRRAPAKNAARRVAYDTNFTTEDWEDILACFGYVCAHCHAKDVKLTLDHVIPLNRGGEHDVENVVPACEPCNYGRGDSLLSEWRQ